MTDVLADNYQNLLGNIIMSRAMGSEILTSDFTYCHCLQR